MHYGRLKNSHFALLFCLRYVYFAFRDKDDIMSHQVTFFGESSIDDGGPRREFFRLLVLQAGESLLRGDNIKFFSLNVPALVVCTENSSNCFM